MGNSSIRPCALSKKAAITAVECLYMAAVGLEMGVSLVTHVCSEQDSVLLTDTL